MELLDRYLNAVRFWLPRAQQEDILAELSEDLRSEIQDREAALGRALSDADVSELLKRRGEPMRVASGFLPQRSLIGPALYPLYVLVLKILAACFVAPWAAVGIVLVALGPRAHAAHPEWSFSQIGQSFVGMAVAVFGFTTLVFAILERNGTAERWQRAWDPRKLPARRDPRRIPRSSSTTEIVFAIVFLSWWVRLPHLAALGGREASIGLRELWPPVYWIVIGLTLGTLAMACANLLHPWWTRWRAGLQLALNLAALAPVALALRVRSWIEVTSSSLSPERVASVSRAINLSVRGAVLLIGVIVVIACVLDVVRLARLRGPRAA